METISELYGWKYGFDHTTKRIIIEPNYRCELPQTLFKFYNVNGNSIDALIHNYIYAAHPSQLNDLFDCSENMIVYDNPHFARLVLKNYRNEILEDCGLDINDMTDEEIINNQQIIENLRRVLWQSIYAKQGIISLTTNPYNILMWSYYSNHNGFCVEYDYEQFPFDFGGPFPINYQPLISELHLRDIPFESAIAAQFNVKNDKWKHEDEWRIMAYSSENHDMEIFGDPLLDKYFGHERKFLYPAKTVKSVILGHRFFDKNEVVFSRDYKTARITLSAKRFDGERLKLLWWLSSHKPSVYISLTEGLNDLHFTKCEISTLENNIIELHILDELI